MKNPCEDFFIELLYNNIEHNPHNTVIKLKNGDYQVCTGLGYSPNYIELKSSLEIKGFKVYNGETNGIKYVVVPAKKYKKYLYQKKLDNLNNDFK